MRLAAVVFFIIEAVLSHMPGTASGAQSQSLSRLTHLPESFLRSFAHVVLFFLLAVFAALGFGWLGVGFCFVWSVADEVTKRGVEGRHCSAVDILLNLAGVVLGMMVWILVLGLFCDGYCLKNGVISSFFFAGLVPGIFLP